MFPQHHLFLNVSLEKLNLGTKIRATIIFVLFVKESNLLTMSDSQNNNKCQKKKE